MAFFAAANAADISKSTFKSLRNRDQPKNQYCFVTSQHTNQTDLSKFLHHLSLEAIGECAFGDVNTEEDTLTSLGELANEASLSMRTFAIHPICWIPGGKYLPTQAKRNMLSSTQRLKSACRRIILNRINGVTKPNEIIGMLKCVLVQFKLNFIFFLTMFFVHSVGWKRLTLSSNEISEPEWRRASYRRSN